MNFESLYDYGKWYVPLNRINQTDIIFNDSHVSAYDDGILTPTVSNMTYVDENTVKISFQDNNFSIGAYKIPNKFDFTATLDVGDTFIAMCHDANSDNKYRIDIFHLYDMNKTHAIFDHYGSFLPKEAECKYPDIIEHGFDVKWREFTKME